MKKNLLDILICPECKSKFNLRVFNEDASGEVLDGILICPQNKHWYFIISGVPRILTGSYKDLIYQQYADYFNKYNRQLNEFGKTPWDEYPPSHFEIKQTRTAQVFGFEWKQFSDYSVDNLTRCLHPYSLNAFRGKLGLDAGCGGGRHLIQCAEQAAAIIGVDLSQAVEQAERKSSGLANAHIVQADIFRLPFREDTFDFIYSLGVLHHLPQPQKGFNCLVDLLKKNGEIYVWVYRKSLRKIILRPIRRIATKLPIKMLFYTAAIVSFIGYFSIIVPGRLIIKVFPFFRKISPSHILEYSSKHNFRVYLTDWFDRLSAPIADHYLPEEIEKWFKAKNMSEIKIKTVEDFWCYGYGRKT